MYRLTEEGEKYLEYGLPEKRLVELLRKGKLSFAEAQKSISEFSIALQWAKKNDWVVVSGNELKLVKEPQSFPEQDALNKINKGEEIDEKILSTLLSRKLVGEDREDMKKKAEKMAGKEITNITEELIRTGIWRQVKFRSYNVEAPGKKIYPGKRQQYNKFLASVRGKLIEMGFKEMSGPTIELEFWNFDALFQPQNHPARDWTQTYSIKYPKRGFLPDKKIVSQVKAAHENGWKTGSTGWGYKWDQTKAAKLIPRAHDTAISPRYLSKGVQIPGKYFQMVRCYRPDVIDAKHGVEFYQMGGVVVGKGLNFRHLLGLLKQFVEEIAGIKETKFVTAYFPFTEPSCEIIGKHPELGWIELAGAGVFRQELTLPLGVKEPAIAWGFGVDRLAMHKLRIDDIRELFSRNLGWLRQVI